MQQSSLSIADKHYIDIEKLQTGEAASFKQLYNLFYDDLLGTAQSILIDQKKASALVNHCFIKCWIRSGELTSMEYTVGYLNFSIRRACLASKENKDEKPANFDEIIKTTICYDVLQNESDDQFLARTSCLLKEQLDQAKEAFGLFYAKGTAMEEIEKELGLTCRNARENLEMAFIVLHLALSREIL